MEPKIKESSRKRERKVRRSKEAQGDFWFSEGIETNYEKEVARSGKGRGGGHGVRYVPKWCVCSGGT